MKKHLDTILPPLIFLVIFLAVWDRFAVFFGIQEFLLPRPHQILQSIIHDRESLLVALRTTTFAATVGLLFSVVLGVVIALFLAEFTIAYNTFFPYMILLPTIPVVAVAPLIVIWYGNGIHSVILVAFWISLFPIIVSTTQGLISIDKNLINLFTINGASRFQILFKLKLPNAVPYLLSGLRISSSMAVIGALVGEIFAGAASADNFGLGYAIDSAQRLMQTAYLFALVMACAFLGLVFYLVSLFIGWYFLHHWHESALSREND